MYKQATELMLNFKDRILIKGEEDTGKSTLLTEIRISDSDSRYYNFKTLNSAGITSFVMKILIILIF